MSKKTEAVDPAVTVTDDVDVHVPRRTPRAHHAGRRSTVSFKLPSKVVNSAAYESDINAMVAGKVPYSTVKKTFYIDETTLPESYEAAFNEVLAAQDAFMTLPPHIREAFNNDPAELARALADPKALPKLKALGLVPQPAPAPSPAKQNPDPADAGVSSKNSPASPAST